MVASGPVSWLVLVGDEHYREVVAECKTEEMAYAVLKVVRRGRRKS